MYLSQQKNNSFLQSQQRSKYFTNNDFISSKVNVLPPKMHRVGSVNSNLYTEESGPISLSEQGKLTRNFSKNKNYYLVPTKTMKDSYNSQSQYTTLSNKDLFQRYSCNLDIEKNSDYLKNNGKMYFSTDRRIQQDLESRVKLLQDKMRKNQQNFKYCSEQMDHLKLRLSSSYSSNLLDSISTNNLTNSIRDPLRQISGIQSFNNKQNLNKNIISIESLTNSPKQLEIEKKVKEIDLIKKQIKKMVSKQQNLRSQVKLFHDSMKDMVKSFKDHLQRSLQSLIKRQDKNKKKIFDQVTETINQKMKEIQVSQSQNLKKVLMELNVEQRKQQDMIKLKVGKDRFMGNPILIKIRQEVFGQVKRQNQTESFSSYVDLIKRNLNSDLGRSSSFSSIQNADTKFNNKNLEQKVSIQQFETTYYLDPEGYLLDSQGYYLISGDEKVKLTQSQLQKLQQNRILQ